MSQNKISRRRRWNSDHYPKAIVVRCTNDEHAEINHRAKLSREPSVSRYLAAAGVRGRAPILREALPPTTKEQREGFQTLLFELHKATANLNQLAQAINIARLLDAPVPPIAEIEQATRSVAELIDDIKGRL